MTEKGRGEGAKERGNDAFKRQDYAEAVGCYTEAILAESTNHVYFLNRSMAYMKLNKYVNVMEVNTLFSMMMI